MRFVLGASDTTYEARLEPCERLAAGAGHVVESTRRRAGFMSLPFIARLVPEYIKVAH